MRYKLLSTSSFIMVMQNRAAVSRIVLKAFSDPQLAQKEEDLYVKKFIVDFDNLITKRIEVKAIADDFRFFSRQTLNLNLLLDEAKVYDVSGKSYHEKQVLKKLVKQQISLIEMDVLPLLKILDGLEARFRANVTDFEELKEKLNIVFVFSFSELRRNLTSLSQMNKIDELENKIKIISDHIFIYHRLLLLKIRYLTDDVRTPMRNLIKYLIEKMVKDDMKS